MEIRSLTQAEAEARAALIDVQRYDIDGRPQRPAHRTRGAVHLRDDLHLRRAGRRLLRRLRGGGGRREPQRRRAGPGRGWPDHPDRPAGRATSSRSRPCRPTPARARACTGPSTRPTARSTSGCRSSRTRPGRSTHASTSPTSRPRTGSRSPRRPRGPWSATPVIPRSSTAGTPAPGPSPTRRRSRRTTRSSTPARSTRSAARWTATTSASSPGSRSRTSSSATPT